MKITKVVVSSLALISILAACGKGKSVTGMSTDLSSSGRSVGSCTISSIEDSDRNLCIEFIQSGSVTSAGVDAARSGCNRANSRTSESVRTTFSSTGCSISGAFGYCSTSETGRQNGETITLNEVMVFKAPLTETESRRICNNASGRYTTTAPSN